MEHVDELLASLKSEGELKARQGFGLDRTKAREKMAKFQLPNPYFYVLELVQAAHCLGAQSIVFRIDSDEMEVSFDGRPLSEEDFENLYVAVFNKADNAHSSALRHLAYAVSAAQALDIRVVRIDTSHPDGTLTWSRRGESESIVQSKQSRSMTRVYVAEKFRPSHLMEFWRALDDNLAEIHTLYQYADMGDVPVLINGVHINRQGMHWRDYRDFITTRRFEDEGYRGIIGVHRVRRRECSLMILRHGVLIETVEFETLIWSFDVILETSSLGTDLSQRAFIRDEQWDRMQRFVYRQFYALFASLLEASFNVPEEAMDSEHSLTKKYLPKNIFKQIMRQVIADRHDWPEVSPELHQLALVGEQFPCFRGATGVEACKYGTLFALKDFGVSVAQRQNTLYRAKDRFVSIEHYNDVMVMRDAEGERLIERYIEDLNVHDVNAILEDLRDGLIQRSRWEHAPKWQMLPERHFPYQHTIQHGPLTLTAALFRPGSHVWRGILVGHHVAVADGTILFFHKEGQAHARLLEMRTIEPIGPSLRYPHLVITVAGPLTTNVRFDRVESTEALAEAMLQILLKVPDLYRALAQDISVKKPVVFSAPHQIIEQFLLVAANRKALSKLYAATGTSKSKVKPRTAWKGTAWEPLLNEALSPEQRLKLLGPIAHVEFIDVVHQPLQSLESLHKRYQNTKMIDVIERSGGKLFRGIKSVIEKMKPIVWFESDDQIGAVLRLLDKRVRFVKNHLKQEVEREAFYQRETHKLPSLTSAYPSEDFLHAKQFEVDGAQVLLGLLDPYGETLTPIQEHTAVLEVYFDHRELDDMELAYPFGQVMGQVFLDARHVDPKSSWRGVEPNMRWKQFSRQIHNCVDELWLEWVELQQSFTHDARDERHLFLLWECLNRWHFLHHRLKGAGKFLKDYPLFEFEGQPLMSLNNAREHVDQQKLIFVPFSLRDVWLKNKPYWPENTPILYGPGERATMHLVKKLLQPRVVDYATTYLEREAQRLARQQRLESLPYVEIPPAGQNVLCEHEIVKKTYRGVLRLKNKTGKGSVRYTFTQNHRQISTGTFAPPLGIGHFEAWLDVDDLVAAYGDEIKPTSAGEVQAMDVLRKECFWLWYELIEVGFADAEDLTESERAVLFDALYLVFKQSLRKANKKAKELRDALWDLPILPTRQGYISLHDALAVEASSRYLFDRHAEHVEDDGVFFTPGDVTQRLRLETMLNQTLQTVDPALFEAAHVERPAKPQPSKPVQPKPSKQRSPQPKVVRQTPAVEAPQKSPEVLSVERLQQTMRRVRGSFRVLLGDAFVHNIQVVANPDAPDVRVEGRQRVMIPRENVIWQQAHKHADDPILQAFLCSHVYSVINIAEHQITDEHELTYQKRLIDDVLKQLDKAQ